MYTCSRTFLRISLDIGQRYVTKASERDVSSRGSGEDNGYLKANAFDEYVESKDKIKKIWKYDESPRNVLQLQAALAYSFKEYNVKKIAGRNGIPVYYHGVMKASWPLDEKYCQTMILLHDKDLEDNGFVKWDDNTLMNRFWELLENNGFPLHVKNSVVRAVMDSTYGTQHTEVSRKRATDDTIDTDGRRDGEDVPTPVERVRDADEEALLAREGELELETELIITDFNEAIPGSIPSVDRHWMNNRTKVELMQSADDIQSKFYDRDKPFTLEKSPISGSKYVNPLLCNERQRYIVTAYMESLISEQQAPLRWIVTGVAGTGKSFVMNILDALAKMEVGLPYASLITAPTGAAAGNVGSSTLDRMFKFKRVAKEYTPLAGGDVMAFANAQSRYEKSILLMVDECFMCGKRIFGHMCQRSAEIFNSGRYVDDNTLTAGRIPAILMFGNPKQLPPVCDKSLLDTSPSDASIDNYGMLFWREFTQYWVLTEPIRQNATEPLIKALTNLRKGYGTESCTELNQDLSFWASRTKERVSRIQHDLFSIRDSETLYATCFNKVRETYNAEYTGKFEEVYIIRAKRTGKPSCIKDAKGSRMIGMAAAIPLTSYLALGMMVKLTINIMPGVCLANQSRGVIRDIIYEDGYDRNELPVVVVEILDYKGEQYITTQDQHTQITQSTTTDRSKYVIIGPTQLRYYCEKYTRTGLPIRVSKADSVHSLQGMTVGDNKTVKRMALNWTTKAESRWPNIMYVGGSRVKKATNIILANPVAQKDLRKIATSSAWEAQDRSLHTMHSKADEQVERRRREYAEMMPGSPLWGSERHYIQTLRKFIQRTQGRLITKLPDVGMS